MKRKRLNISFVRVPNFIIRTLPPSELRIWCTIQTHAPSYCVTLTTIMNDLGVKHKYSIQPILKSLLEKGYISAVPMPEHNGALRYKAFIPEQEQV